MAAVTMTFDGRRFAAALRKVIVVTKKAEAAIVNKALKDVAFRAAKFTPKSSVAKINSISTVVLAKLAAAHLKKTKGRYTKQDLRDYMLRIMKARRQRIAALRVGWAPAIEAFGGSFRGGKKKPGSTISQGGAKLATPTTLQGLIENTIVTRSADGKHGAGEIPALLQALDAAIEDVTIDRENYAQGKLEKALQSVSD